MSDHDTVVFLISRLQEEINRLINEFTEHGEGGFHEDSGWHPNVDVLETESTLEILVELPGIEVGDLELEIAGSEVTIGGRKDVEYGTRDHRFRRMERPRSTFRRQIALQRAVNGSLATASLEDGLLRVSLPKVEDKRRKARPIPIQRANDNGSEIP